MGHWLRARFTTLLVASSGSAKFPRTVAGFPLLSSSRTNNRALPHRHALVAILNAWLPGTYSLIRMQSIHLSHEILLPAFFHNINFNSSWTGRRCVVYHLSSHKHSCTPNKTIRISSLWRCSSLTPLMFFCHSTEGLFGLHQLRTRFHSTPKRGEFD